MKKRVSSIIAVCLLLSMVLTACGGDKNVSPDASAPANTPEATAAQETASPAPAIKGKIVFMSNRIDLEDKFKEISAAFHEKYPEAEVEIQTNKDYNNVIKVRIASGDAPDVFPFTIDIIPMGKVLEDTLLPLDDMGYTKDTIALYDLPAHTYNGKHYGLTDGAIVTGILASKKTLQDAGITSDPKTLDELYAACEKFKAKDIPCFGSMVKSGWPLGNWDTVRFGFMNESYADLLKQMIASDTPITKDSPYVKTGTFIRTLLDKGYFDKDLTSSDWDVLRKQMDKVGMLMLANYGIGALEGLKPEEIAFFPIPIDNSGTPVSVRHPDWDLGINKNTKSPEVAKAFVRFMLDGAGYQDAVGLAPSVFSAKSNNAALQYLINSNPRFIEGVSSDPDVTAAFTEITKKGQIDFSQMYTEVLLNKDNDLQPIFDKYNNKWAEAKKALGK